jgi:hypothetical protein
MRRDELSQKVAEEGLESLTPKERRELERPLTRNVNFNRDSVASIIGEYWNAVKMFVHGTAAEPGGTTKYLDRFKAEYGERVFIAIKETGVAFELETDPNWLMTYADYGLFQEGQELDLDETISSPEDIYS